MKANERILLPNGKFAAFPDKERRKAEKLELVKPLPEEVKEVSTNPPGKLKKHANRKAKKNNEAQALKQKKFDEAQES